MLHIAKFMGVHAKILLEGKLSMEIHPLLGSEYLVFNGTWKSFTPAYEHAILAFLLRSKYDYVWVEVKDDKNFYEGERPFAVKWVGVANDDIGDPLYVLEVHGRYSKRIRKKWTDRLGEYFGKRVELFWPEEET